MSANVYEIKETREKSYPLIAEDETTFFIPKQWRSDDGEFDQEKCDGAYEEAKQKKIDGQVIVSDFPVAWDDKNQKSIGVDFAGTLLPQHKDELNADGEPLPSKKRFRGFIARSMLEDGLTESGGYMVKQWLLDAAKREAFKTEDQFGYYFQEEGYYKKEGQKTDTTYDEDSTDDEKQED